MSELRIVAIGSSIGGLAALQTILPQLPAGLGLSVVIAQHRRPDPNSHLVELLSYKCALRVCEPEDKAPLEPDVVYVAPGDYHLLVERGNLALSVDPPVSFARPSIDVLFESVADAYGPNAVAVMLTSSNHDGAEGARAIKRAGGRVLVQDPRTAESPIGPKSVLEATRVDRVVELGDMAKTIVSLCCAQLL
jgi:two-component system chemotaxis response regulator CheB